MVLSSMLAYPHTLAYFNEGAGGPGMGYRLLAHSNLDWGQDELLLREWVRALGIPSRHIRVCVDCPFPEYRRPGSQGGDHVTCRDWVIVSAKHARQAGKPMGEILRGPRHASDRIYPLGLSPATDMPATLPAQV